MLLLKVNPRNIFTWHLCATRNRYGRTLNLFGLKAWTRRSNWLALVPKMKWKTFLNAHKLLMQPVLSGREAAPESRCSLFVFSTARLKRRQNGAPCRRLGCSSWSGRLFQTGGQKSFWICFSYIPATRRERRKATILGGWLGSERTSWALWITLTFRFNPETLQQVFFKSQRTKPVQNRFNKTRARHFLKTLINIKTWQT